MLNLTFADRFAKQLSTVSNRPFADRFAQRRAAVVNSREPLVQKKRSAYSAAPSLAKRQKVAHDGSRGKPNSKLPQLKPKVHAGSGRGRKVITCPREKWQAFGQKWQKTLGTFSQGSLKVTWLQPADRPCTSVGNRVANQFSVGCVVCNWFSNSSFANRGGVKKNRRWSTKWSRYQITKLMQSQQIRLHSEQPSCTSHFWLKLFSWLA